MKLITGLGNPGKEYEMTRHNAGFLAVDRLVSRYQLNARNAKAKFHGAVLEGVIEGEKCLLLKPMTFMNRSGLAVAEAATFYKLDADAVLVIVDDVALPAGAIRLRGEGSAGGHNGLTDIERSLGTRAYARLRIGIDAPGRVPLIDYVLGRFGSDQWPAIDVALDQSVDAVAKWLRDGIDKAMTAVNARSA